MKLSSCLFALEQNTMNGDDLGVARIGVAVADAQQRVVAHARVLGDLPQLPGACRQLVAYFLEDVSHV